MKRFILVSCAAIALFSLPMRAAVQPMVHADSKKAEISLSEATLIGTTTVAAGEYTFQCMQIDGKDFLVVEKASNGKEVARVPCTPENLKGKASSSDYSSARDPKGVKVMTVVRIKGETVAHHLVVN